MRWRPTRAGAGLATIARRACAASLCALGVCAVASPALAGAAPPVGLVVSVQPASGRAASYFKLEGRRGRRVRAGVVVLADGGTRPIRAVLDPVDAQTLDTLGSTYLLPGTRSHGATLWLRLSRQRVVIPAGGRATVTVTVDVPRRARAGDRS